MVAGTPKTGSPAIEIPYFCPAARSVRLARKSPARRQLVQPKKQVILARKPDGATPRRALARYAAGFGLMLVVGVAAFGVAPDTTIESVPVERITRELAVSLSPAGGSEGMTYWREERIQRGDTLGSVLARLGVDDPGALEFVRVDSTARRLYQLRPGRPLRAEVDEAGALRALRYLTSSGDLLSIERDAESFSAQLGAAPSQTEVRMATGHIRSSLFGAADEAGVPDGITMQLAEIFSGDIDFYKDLRRGDRFSVVYEMVLVEGEPLRFGRVLAAEFVNKGEAFRAFAWRTPSGSDGFYTEDGKSLRKAFLRSPMQFSRITSGFSLARLHPIHKVWRAHKGVDYAAPTGTPVRATADGKVEFAGVKGGYGRVVILRHHGAYSTLYAHLSRLAPGMRRGARVAQGETIGFVGQTGWATGPHLHYEFRVNDTQRDPLRIALPEAPPISRSELSAFRAATAPLVSQIELLRGLPIAAVN